MKMLIYILLLHLLVALAAESESCNFDVLFVFHDAGESLMGQPIIDRWLQEKSVISIGILALGSPASSIYANYTAQLLSPSDVGILTPVVDGNDGRSQELPAEDLARLVGTVKARVCVVGMVYAMQAQIASAMHEQGGSYTVGLDDSFALWSEEGISSALFIQPTAPSVVQEVFLCADEQAKGVAADTKKHGSSVLPTVTGSPTLTTWRSAGRDEAAKAAARKVAYPMTRVHPDAPGVLYAGGYGGLAYNASLRVFCLTARDMYPSVLYSFSPHPGYSPSLEVELFAEWGCSSAVTVVPTEAGFSTAQLVAASNASLSQCSTVGGQAVAGLGLPHAFLSSSESCDDVFSATGLIPHAPSERSLRAALERFSQEGWRIQPSDVEAAGIPLDGTRLMSERIVSLLSR